MSRASISMTNLRNKAKQLNDSPAQKECYLLILKISKETFSFPLPTEMAEIMGVTKGYIHDLLETLVLKGFVKKISRYHYRLA